MSTQQVPSPVELYEAAAKQTRRALAGVKPDQFSKPTPCTQWNVQALVDHVIGASNFIASTLSGAQPSQAPAGRKPLDAYDAAVAAALKAARAPGALDKKVKTPMGEMAGGDFLTGLFMDNLIHGWDLAKATGQSTKLDPKLVDACYTVFAPRADMMRKGGAFGPAVQVPASASTQDKLLGALGRKP